ncbi:hypothetical protein K1719_028744 [Acacia pycnantha]|nr:hypothetical protein K1719_028744 [Acacia pycnantha]
MVDVAAPVQQGLPVGFRFRPTDEELVGHYLRHKLLADEPSIHNIIPEIDVCKFEPWELPAILLNTWDDPEWYFFCPRHYKYSNSTRRNRATARGYWKVTGKERNIRDPVTNNIIGTKKSLVFYDHGIKSNWVIHEYHDATFQPDQRTHVLCKLLKKPEKKTEEKSDELVYDESEPNDHIASEYANPAKFYTIPEVQYFTYMEDSMMTQTPLESDDLGSSMIQTPREVDSTMEESEEFDFRSFLRSSPRRDG